VGRLIDRRGAALPLIAGLAAAPLLLAVLRLPRSPLLLAIVTVLALGGPLTAYAMPAISIMTDAIEQIGAALAVGSMLVNLGVLAAAMLATLAVSVRLAPRWSPPATDRPASRRESRSR
jgi:predicted MFS family arabinose efflux permease